jgi:hypothetical protein
MDTNELLIDGENKRPKFLQTLCILSFIMCGLMILMSAWGLKTTYFPSDKDLEMQQQQMEMLQNINPSMYDTVMEVNETKGVSTIASLLAQIFSLIGVMMMWQLKKTGFYIYTIAELIPYGVTLILNGTKGYLAMAGMFGESMQSLFYIIMILAVLVDIGFIIMYAVNTKYMS